VQPPLQPARQKPFPLRPHHRRRQTVFAALATASPNATTRELIVHVRAITGLGCSPKLIAAWKRERGQRAGKQERTGEGQKKWLAVQMRLFFFLLACGCGLSLGHWVRQVGAQEIIISPVPSAPPESQPLPLSAPRLLRIKLTLQSPHELRVKAGDNINAGNVLSHHQTTRQRLLRQRRMLQVATSHLRAQMRLTHESLRQLQSLGLDLPPTTFAAERAAIQRTEAEAITAQRLLAMQQERLSVVRCQLSVASSVKSIDPTENEPLQAQPQLTTDNEQLTMIEQHEVAKLTQAQDKQLLAHSEIEWHKAKLTTAREVRAWDEQKHRVELTRQILSARSQQQQVAIEWARLTAQIAELDLQLAQLIAVRAPFAGTIKRIEWEEMNDEKLTVWVYLAVGSR
jgi:hypothetical protein